MSSLNPILGVASSKKKPRKRPNHVSFRPGVKKGITTTNRTPIRKPNTSTTTSTTTTNSSSSNKIAIPSSQDDTTTTTTTTVDPKQTSTNNTDTENETTSNTTTGTAKVGKLSKPKSRPGIRPRPILRPGGRKPKIRGAVTITPSIHNNNDNNNNNSSEKEPKDVSTQQQPKDNSSNDTAVVQKEVMNQSALDVISTTISSSVPRGSDKFDKEKEMSMVPYQFLGKLDPSWNIPAPKQGEKTMKEFCSKFPIPRERNSRKNSNNRGTKNNNNNDPEDVTSVVTSSSSVKLERSYRNHNSQSPVTTNNGPAVEIINGEIVIQQSSITISNRKTMKEIDEEYLQEEGDLVVEDVTNGIIQATYRSFLKETPKTQHWTPTETHQFYNVLRQCGTDFSMMTSFFPDRTRKQLKKKYLQESRKHPRLIDLAMNPHTHLPVDTTVFGQLDMTNVTDVKELADHQVDLNAEKEPPKIVSPSPVGEMENGMEVVGEMENGMEVVEEEADNHHMKQKQDDLFADENKNNDNDKQQQEEEEEAEAAADTNVTLGLFGGKSKKKNNKARPKFKVVKKRPTKKQKMTK